MDRRNMLVGSLAGIATASMGLPAAADSGANMGALDSQLMLGETKPWTGTVSQGFYILSNSEGFNSIYALTIASPPVVTRVSIDVFPVGTEAYSSAGLAFNLEGNARETRLLAVTLRPDGSLITWDYSNANGLTNQAEMPAQGLRNDVVTRLALQVNSSGVDILTNEQRCGSFAGIRLKGRIGILAVDRGSFYFANFYMS